MRLERAGTQVNSGDPSRDATASPTAQLIASAGGLGFIPLAPGTAAAAATAFAIWLWAVQSMGLLTVVAVIVTGLGVAACGRYEQDVGKDPQSAVIDEVAGMLVSVLWLPTPLTGTLVIVAFVLFRVFDIAKPPPVNLAEHLPSGWGVMADDLVAGLYANIIVRVLIWWERL